MDPESLRAALADHQFLPSVVQDEREAELVGVSGVPAFIAARRIALTGVQPVQKLKTLVLRARESE